MGNATVYTILLPGYSLYTLLMRCFCRIEQQNEMTTLGLKLNVFFASATL